MWDNNEMIISDYVSSLYSIIYISYIIHLKFVFIELLYFTKLLMLFGRFGIEPLFTLAAVGRMKLRFRGTARGCTN